MVYLLLTLLSLCPFIGFAIPWVDVSSFRYADQTGLRALVFDPDEQRLVSITYILAPRGPLSLPGLEGLTIHPDGTVLLERWKAKKAYVVQYWAQGGLQLLFSRDSGKIPRPLLPKRGFFRFSKQKSGKGVALTFWRQGHRTVRPSLGKIFEDPASNSAERGKIGEKVTEITMRSRGWIKVDSQNKANQGFDGIFFDNASNPSWVVLTESKCRSEKKRAMAYLAELNEEHMLRKIEQLPCKSPLRGRLIWFVREFPGDIYRLAQRVCADGQVESAWAPPLNILRILSFAPFMVKKGRALEAFLQATGYTPAALREELRSLNTREGGGRRYVKGIQHAFASSHARDWGGKGGGGLVESGRHSPHL